MARFSYGLSAMVRQQSPLISSQVQLWPVSQDQTAMSNKQGQVTNKPCLVLQAMASHAQPYPTKPASQISHGQKARSNQVWVAIGTYQLRSFRQGHIGHGHDHSYVQLFPAICQAMASHVQPCSAMSSSRHANPLCYTGLFWPPQTFFTLPPTKAEC
mgnify:CR=1 FL=1